VAGSVVAVQVAEAAVRSVRSVAPQRGAAERTAPTPVVVDRALAADQAEAPAASPDTAAFRLRRTAVRRKAGRPRTARDPALRCPGGGSSAVPVSPG